MSEPAPWSSMMMVRAAPRPPRSRAVGLALAGVAIAALVFALFADRWLEGDAARLTVSLHDKGYVWGPEHDVRIGLRSMTVCPGARCDSLGYGSLPAAWPEALLGADGGLGGGTAIEAIAEQIDVATPASREEAAVVAGEMFHWSGAFIPMARTVLIALVIAVICLALSAGLVAAGKRGRFPIYPTTPAVMALAVALVAGCILVAHSPGPSGYVGIGPCYWAFGVGVVTGVLAAIWLSPHLHPKDEDWS
jgi:hypothetical protein